MQHVTAYSRLAALDLSAWRQQADAGAVERLRSRSGRGVALTPLDCGCPVRGGVWSTGAPAGPAATAAAQAGAAQAVAAPVAAPAGAVPPLAVPVVAVWPAPAWCVPGVAGPGAGRAPVVSATVAALVSAVDGLVALPVSGCPVDLAVVLTQAERLRGVGLFGLGELEVSRGYAADGSVSAAAWLRRTLVVSDDSARAAVRLAGRLRAELADLGRALLAGRTTVEHVRAVAAGTAGLDSDLVAAAGAALVELAAVAAPATVRLELRRRAESIHPALGRDAARRQRARRGFYADAVGGAGVLLGGALDDEDGAVLLHALDLAVKADRDDAGTAAAAPRGLPARRADALVGWARRAALELAGPGDTAAQDAHTVRSHLLITCTAEQLAALATANAHSQLDLLGAPLTGAAALAVLTGRTSVQPAVLPTEAPLLPAALRRLACDTTFSLIVHPHLTAAAAGAGGAGEIGAVRVEPLYVGRSSRTVSGAQFKALVVRDRHCIVRGCHRRPSQCQAHHVRHWLDGGPTDLDNLVHR